MTTPIRVLFNNTDSEATGYQRILSPLNELQQLGLVETQPLNQSDARKQMKWADLLLLQCLVGPQNFDLIKKFKEAGIPVVIDYDDNFAELPDNILKHLKMTREEAAKNWKQYLSLADTLTCPCPYLGQIMQKYSENKVAVKILPNYLTTEEYCGATNYRPKEDGEVRILYSFSDSHINDFKWISSLLMYLGETYPQVRLISHGNVNLSYMYPDYQGKSSHELYAPYLGYHPRLREISPHICLGPLLKNDHAYCRSDIKYLQTASVKAVFVGSDAPPYQNTVLHGKTGLLPSSKLRWWWYLRKLIRNPSLRQEMGQAAYQHAKQFILKDHVLKWYDLYYRLVNS